MRHLLVTALMSLSLPAGPAAAQSADVARLELDATHGIAPQIPQVASAFRRARPVQAERFDGMLVCEARVVRESWDGEDPTGPVRRFMGRAELDTEFELPGRADVVRTRGPDDTSRLTFAIAGVSLAPGDEVRVRLFDRDVLSRAPISAFALRYEGRLPWVAQDAEASIECRGVPERALSARIRRAVTDADRAIEALDLSARPSPELPTFRADDPAPAKRALYELASWVGLADTRFLTRRDHIRAHEAEFLDAARALVQSLRDASPPLSEPVEVAPGVRFALEEYDCKLDEMLMLQVALGLDATLECALHVRVQADAASRLDATLHVVDDLGRAVPITRFATIGPEGPSRLRELRVPAGASQLALPVATSRGALLRVEHGETRVFLRLALPTGDGDVAAEAGVESRIDLRVRPTHPPAGRGSSSTEPPVSPRSP